MVVPLAASANTGPFALGFQPVGTPLGTSTAARLLRKTPPRLVKLPPTKTLLVPAPSDKANTEALATLGFHAVAFPVAGASAPTLLWPAPPPRATRPTPGRSPRWDSTPCHFLWRGRAPRFDCAPPHPSSRNRPRRTRRTRSRRWRGPGSALASSGP